MKRIRVIGLLLVGRVRDQRGGCCVGLGGQVQHHEARAAAERLVE